MKGLVAKATTEIVAPPERVWKALTDPATIKQYYFGTTLESSWKPGTPITFKGVWQGRAYEDKGVIQTFDPPRTLAYTHFSALGGKKDAPENYHLVTISLEPSKKGTRVTLEQDNNETDGARSQSQKNWEMMLSGLKKVVEER